MARRPPTSGIIALGVLLAPLLLVPRAAAQGTVQGPVVCESCHGNREFLVGKVGTPAQEAELFVPDSLLRETRHRTLACADCHRGYAAGYPHRVDQTAVPCGTCHPAPAGDWAQSIHAVNVAAEGDAPTCIGCHYPHTVYGADDRRSPVHPLNVAATCGRCHADPRIVGTYFASPEEAQARRAVALYHETVHGAALTQAGLVVSATCNDCHAGHEVLPSDDPESTINRANIAETCGNCHEGILAVYEGSAHGLTARQRADPSAEVPAPVCTDCHTAHEIVPADDPEWFLGAVEECGSCHEELYETYLETYHGKVTKLGSGLAATCADCHTAHDMRPASDPRSSVHFANLVTTCARCHPRANRNFVKYYVHADPHDADRYPVLFGVWLFMTLLLAGVFTFFGAHTALWLARLAIERSRGGGPPPGATHD